MIILYYLSNDDYKNFFSYKTALARMQAHTLVEVTTREDLMAFFENYDYDNNKILICAHGGTTGISKTQDIDDSFVEWQELLDSLGNIGVENLNLNLCAICDSHNILNFTIPEQIDLILYSKTSVNSILAALELFENNYITRINNFEDDEGELIYSYQIFLNL